MQIFFVRDFICNRSFSQYLLLFYFSGFIFLLSIFLGSSILHVQYSDDLNVDFFADSGGSVFELRLKRGLRGAGGSARCIFSGARGEVCTMAPLRVGASANGGVSSHPLGDYSILALATISKVIVVTVKPRLKVLLTTPLTGGQSHQKKLENMSL